MKLMYVGIKPDNKYDAPSINPVKRTITFLPICIAMNDTYDTIEVLQNSIMPHTRNSHKNFNYVKFQIC